MRKETVELFHELMKKGWIDRTENTDFWNYVEDDEIQEELDCFKDVLGFDTYRINDRFYIIPTQDNDLFLKNNVDYRRDIKASSDFKLKDLYLLNYLAIYIIYLFYGGEGNEPLRRDFISKESLLNDFTKHCESVEKANTNIEDEIIEDYSDNFIKLAKDWLQKIEGESVSNKQTEKYGIINKILIKFRNDDLFICGDDNLIRPTRKMNDLIYYFLRKDRINDIQKWIREGEENASN